MVLYPNWNSAESIATVPRARKLLGNDIPLSLSTISGPKYFEIDSDGKVSDLYAAARVVTPIFQLSFGGANIDEPKPGSDDPTLADLGIGPESSLDVVPHHFKYLTDFDAARGDQWVYRWPDTDPQEQFPQDIREYVGSPIFNEVDVSPGARLALEFTFTLLDDPVIVERTARLLFSMCQRKEEEPICLPYRRQELGFKLFRVSESEYRVFFQGLFGDETVVSYKVGDKYTVFVEYQHDNVPTAPYGLYNRWDSPIRAYWDVNDQRIATREEVPSSSGQTQGTKTSWSITRRSDAALARIASKYPQDDIENARIEIQYVALALRERLDG